MSTPNTEWILYDTGQWIPFGGVIILLPMAILIELWTTEKKAKFRKGRGSAGASTEHSSSRMKLPRYRPR